MATSEVISLLVRSLQPVTPLPVPARRFTRWMALAGVAAIAVVLAVGPRPDLLDRLTSAPFVAHVVLLLLAACGSALAALVLAAPGEQLRAPRRAMPVAAAAAWVSWLSVELISQASSGGPVWPVIGGWGCMAKAFAVGAAPGLLLVRMVGRGEPTEVRQAMTFAVLAGTATGALGVEVTCPVGSPLHLLVWHAGPVLAVVAAAAVFPGELLAGARRIARRVP